MSKGKITSIRGKGTVIANAQPGTIIVNFNHVLGRDGASITLTRVINGRVIQSSYKIYQGHELLIEVNGEENMTDAENIKLQGDLIEITEYARKAQNYLKRIHKSSNLFECPSCKSRIEISGKYDETLAIQHKTNCELTTLVEKKI